MWWLWKSTLAAYFCEDCIAQFQYHYGRVAGRFGEIAMHRSNLKTAYLQAKTETDQLAPERQHLGHREVQTLRLLATEVGFTAEPKATLLDLGCAIGFWSPPVKLKAGTTLDWITPKSISRWVSFLWWRILWMSR